MKASLLRRAALKTKANLAGADAGTEQSLVCLTFMKSLSVLDIKSWSHFYTLGHVQKRIHVFKSEWCSSRNLY